MHSSGVVFASPLRAVRSAVLIVGLSLIVLASSAFVLVSPARAADARPGSAAAESSGAPARLKAVFIVGPAGPQTSSDLADAEALAVIAESYGMDVRRVFHPNATWEAVMANVQGANLVYYAGHGYGWPSPYTSKMTESRQNGVGLNSYAGSDTNTYTYYGADVIRANWVLAPNSLVFLNHLCYSAGNGEPGMAIPSWDLARQRVDNFAAGFLAVGARAVFAYPYGRFNVTLRQLFTTDLTVEEMFRTAGTKPHPYYGWVGWDARKFDSVRTPGAKNFMDPHENIGFGRAVTGDLTMTAADWGQGVGDDQPPTISDFRATAPVGTSFAASATPFFTPNGDGVTDSLDMTFTVDREAFVDFAVRNDAGNVVRTLSAWSAGGAGTVSWNGRSDGGSYVADGPFTITATPRNRAGTEGNTERLDVNVMTTMRSPSVSPNLFYAADGDSLASRATLSVTLDAPATFWWKVADADGNVVRTHLNGVEAGTGNVSWQWDGRDNSGAFVPDGTYYSVTTTTTGAGTYFHSLPVEVRAFRLTTAAATPFVRGTAAKFLINSAEPLSAKPKVKVYAPGLSPSKKKVVLVSPGVWRVKVPFSTSASAGTLRIQVFSTDSNGQYQSSDYYYQLK